MNNSIAENPCKRCTKGCCRHYLVTITGYDAWYISHHLKLDYGDFVVGVPHKGGHRMGFILEKGGQIYDIALDKKSVNEETGLGNCVFLIDFEFGHYRCGIYPFRPFVCKTYPGVIQNLKLVKREDVLCPDDAWKDSFSQNGEIGYDLLEIHFQYDLFEKLIEQWNHRVNTELLETSIRQFYDYLHYFYCDFENFKNDYASEEWDTLLEKWCLISYQLGNPFLKDHNMKETKKMENFVHDQLHLILD